MSTFLVLEDYPPIARQIGLVLRRRGHAVAYADRVQPVLDAAERFDHAVLDIDLPDGSGIEVADCLLETGRVESVVFYTACQDPAVIAQAARLGLVVDKRAGLGLLAAALGRLVARREALAVNGGQRRCGGTKRSGARRIRRGR